MIKVIVHGCNGKMGQVISNILREDEEAAVVAGIDVYDEKKNDYLVYSAADECQVDADVIIDFSNAQAVDALLAYSERRRIPEVLSTTGLSEDQLEKVKALSGKVAVLKSANMSLGVNTLMDLLRKAAAVLAPAGFDIEIVERHHNQKVDAPSGTALALADAINETMDWTYEYQYDRSSRREKRGKHEIGISAVRGGTIVGEHDVIFAGNDEVIEIKHTAFSKAIFAKGAVEAAKFLAGRPAGMYDMQDVIKNRK